MPRAIALVLGVLATATAPAATVDVVQEARADGPFSRTLLGIVAVDDAWGLILFSLVLTSLEVVQGQGRGLDPLLMGAWELGGAVVIGVLLGVPLAYLSGRCRRGQPTLLEALGIVFLCGGVALWLNVSFLLASIVLGMTVANLARHHTRPFHAIEDIERPFIVLFFVLAGASFHLQALGKIGLIGIAYVLLRASSRVAGAWVGGRVSRADPVYGRWMGLALMPQAGVALGMALIAGQRFPEAADTLLPVAIGATVVFELFGPVLTRMSLNRAGETRPSGDIEERLEDLPV